MVGGWHCRLCRSDDAALNMIRQAEWETEFAAVLAKAPYEALSNVQVCTIEYDDEDQSSKAVFRSNFDLEKDASVVIGVNCEGADLAELSVPELSAVSKKLKDSYNAIHRAIDGDEISLESLQVEGNRVFSGLDSTVEGWVRWDLPRVCEVICPWVAHATPTFPCHSAALSVVSQRRRHGGAQRGVHCGQCRWMALPPLPQRRRHDAGGRRRAHARRLARTLRHELAQRSGVQEGWRVQDPHVLRHPGLVKTRARVLRRRSLALTIITRSAHLRTRGVQAEFQKCHPRGQRLSSLIHFSKWHRLCPDSMF